MRSSGQRISPVTARWRRFWEMHLRKEIFWGTQMGDDYTIEPCFNVFHIHPAASRSGG